MRLVAFGILVVAAFIIGWRSEKPLDYPAFEAGWGMSLTGECAVGDRVDIQVRYNGNWQTLVFAANVQQFFLGVSELDRAALVYVDDELRTRPTVHPGHKYTCKDCRLVKRAPSDLIRCRGDVYECKVCRTKITKTEDGWLNDDLFDGRFNRLSKKYQLTADEADRISNSCEGFTEESIQRFIAYKE